MYNDHKLMEHIARELDKKAENGIRSTSDLDTVAKLAQTMKDLTKAKYYCVVTEAMEEGGYSEADGYTERGRRRDRMGRYARSDGHDRGNRYEGGSSYHDPMMDYHDARHTYASTRTPDSKRDMTESLTECLHTMKGDLQDMLNGATTREERDKIKSMLREIGNLA